MRTGRIEKSEGGSKLVLARIVKRTPEQDANLLERLLSEVLSRLKSRKQTPQTAAEEALADPRLAPLFEQHSERSGKAVTVASLARLLAERLAGERPGPAVEQVTEPAPSTVRRADARTSKSASTIAAQLDALSELHKAAETQAEHAGWRATYGPFDRASAAIRQGKSFAEALAILKAA